MASSVANVALFNVEVEGQSYAWSSADLLIYLTQISGSDLNVDFIWPATSCAVISDATLQILSHIKPIVGSSTNERLKRCFDAAFANVRSLRFCHQVRQLDPEATQLAMRQFEECSVLQLEQILNQCPHIIELDFEGCVWITPAHLDCITSRLPQLIKLNLTGCVAITPVGGNYNSLKPLRTLTKLEELRLSGCTGISGRDLMDLEPLAFLKIVDLSYCPNISDQALICLRPLIRLQHLFVMGCNQISEINLKCFRMTHPEACSVHWTQENSANTWTLSDLQEILRPLTLAYSQRNIWSVTNTTVSEPSVLQILEQIGIQIEKLGREHADLKKLYNRAHTNVKTIQVSLKIASLSADITEIAIKDIGISSSSHLEDLATQCPSLTKISFQDCNWLKDEDLSQLHVFKNVRELNFSHCENLTNNGLQNLAGLAYDQLSHLEVLLLPGCYEITDEGISHIVSINSLCTLDLSFCKNLTRDVLYHLQSLPNLRELSLINCVHIDEESVLFFRINSTEPCRFRLVHEEYRLSTWTSERFIAYLEQFRRFKAQTMCREMNEKIISEKTYRRLLHLQPKIQELQGHSLPGSNLFKLCSHVLDIIEAFPVLLLTHCMEQTITDLDLTHLKRCSVKEFEEILLRHTQVAHMNLSLCPWVTSQHITCLKHSPQLLSLNLSGCTAFEDRSLAHFRHLRNIQELNIAGCTQLTNGACAHLNLQSLKKLDVSGCIHISDEGVMRLTAPSFESINLSACSITEACFAVINKPTLKSLNLRGCTTIQQNGFRILADFTSLEYLDVSRTRISDLLSIANLKALKELVMQHCNYIRDRELACLCILSKLRNLDLQGLNITNECLKSLRLIDSLSSLNVTGCDRISENALKSFRATNAHSCHYAFRNGVRGHTWNVDQLVPFVEQLDRFNYRDSSALWMATHEPIISRGTLVVLQGILEQYQEVSSVNQSGLLQKLQHAVLLLQLFLSLTKETTELVLNVPCSHEQLASLLQRCPKITRFVCTSSDWMSDFHVTVLKTARELREVDISHCQWIVGTTLNQLSKLQNLVTLNFNGCHRLTGEQFSIFSALQNLESLHFSGCNRVESKHFFHLEHLEKLRELDVSGCNFVDCNLALLVKAKFLRHLNLSKCPITSEVLTVLRHFNELSHLEVKECKQLTEMELRWFRVNHSNRCRVTFTNANGSSGELTTNSLSLLKEALILLIDLDLSGIWRASNDTVLSQETFKLLSLLKLSVFDVSAPWEVRQLFKRALDRIDELCFVCSNSLSSIRKLPNLGQMFVRKYLDMNLHGQCSPQELEELFLKTPGLTHVSFKNCSWLTGKHLAKLHVNPNIRYLDLSGTQITDNDLYYLGSLPKLTRLNLSSCHNIYGRGLQYIAGLIDLEYLNVSNCIHLEDKHFQPLLQLTKLTHVDLSLCINLEGSCLAYFVRNQHLSYLDISNWITAPQLEPLRAFQRLYHLNLSYNTHITPEMLAPLSALLYLRELYLSQCNGVCQYNIEGLPALPSLQYLGLDHLESLSIEGIVHRDERVNLPQCGQLEQIKLKNGTLKLAREQREHNFSYHPD